MDEDVAARIEAVRSELVHLHNKTLGEAMYASVIAQAAFQLTVRPLPPAEKAEIVDQLILVLEKQQGVAKDNPAAIERARSRLESLRTLLANLPAKSQTP